jgi:plasmid stabilization system protein ParE
MQAETVWLDQALDDLKEILEYISADSPQAAARYVRELQEICQRLRDFPLWAVPMRMAIAALFFATISYCIGLMRNWRPFHL